jgi:hypothetical protein
MVGSALLSLHFFPYVCHRRKVPDDLLIALNPEEDSSLPYLIRIPLGTAGIVLKDQGQLAANLEAVLPPGRELASRTRDR